MLKTRVENIESDEYLWKKLKISIELLDYEIEIKKRDGRLKYEMIHPGIKQTDDIWGIALFLDQSDYISVTVLQWQMLFADFSSLLEKIESIVEN